MDFDAQVVLITGKGQIGTALLQSLQAKGCSQITLVDIEEMDITDRYRVNKVFAGIKPTLVFHTSALTKVDYCERNPEEAMLVNATGTEHVTLGARQVGARLIYFSTDYVFPGKDDGEYSEEEKPEPINAYGRSKLAGEFYALEYEKALVIRTAQVFAPGGRNFLAAIRWKLEREEEVQVVSDEIATPTYAPHLAEALLALLPLARDRIYHIRGPESLSYFEWARRFAKLARLDQEKLKPISAKEFSRDAPRPRRAVLSIGRYLSTGLSPLPPLDETMKSYLLKDGC